MDKPEQVSVTLTKIEQDIINRENNRRGNFNFSGTLRQIIREWNETHKRHATTDRGGDGYAAGEK